MRVKCKYATVNITEDDKGAINVRVDTMDNVMVQMESTNALTFHILRPSGNVIKTMKSKEELQ